MAKKPSTLLGVGKHDFYSLKRSDASCFRGRRRTDLRPHGPPSHFKAWLRDYRLARMQRARVHTCMHNACIRKEAAQSFIPGQVVFTTRGVGASGTGRDVQTEGAASRRRRTGRTRHNTPSGMICKRNKEPHFSQTSRGAANLQTCPAIRAVAQAEGAKRRGRAASRLPLGATGAALGGANSSKTTDLKRRLPTCPRRR